MLGTFLVAIALLVGIMTFGLTHGFGLTSQVKTDVGGASPQAIVDYARNVVGDATKKENQGLEDVGDSVPSPASAHVLDLSNKGLTRVPGSTFAQTDLEELNISHNNLTGALQAEVRHLSNLRVLTMSHNQFTGVPAEVGQLSKLEALDLSYNKLTGLPNELGTLSHLKLLDLRGNAYAKQDLDGIRAKLPATTVIKTD